MFEELLLRKRLNEDKALRFGFVRAGDAYRYETDVLGGAFRLHTVIAGDGGVDTQLIEKESGEEYILYKTSAVGSFVGSVRSAVEEAVAEIVRRCYEPEVFRSPQAKEIISYVGKKYGDELEFLWKRFPDNAVWRRGDTGKWYGAVLTVARRKLGLDSDETAEIIDLRIQPERMEALLAQAHFYPGWHMNKKSWYTVILDGSVSTQELCRRIDESYSLAK